MKQGSTLFLKFVVTLIGIITFLGLLWFPQTEGAAVNKDLLSIYTNPFIIYIYIGSIPFFVGLSQAIKLLGYIDANKAFTQEAVNILKNMKLSALSLIGFILLALIFIRFAAAGDDPAGPTAIGLVVIFASGVIATAAGVFQKLLQNAVDIKSENDLTV